ncbi:MAG: nickel pincer cofactor biosynthesis protein LarB, partial [Candidatus Latescibacteria bacterium]|nr:nickel pincer cofactor biosynthesis protein LarB [Candidatus Latescibacterota bacterium]
MQSLANLPFEDLGFARIDHHRALRQGFPEVIFCEGKTTSQVVDIAKRIVDTGATLLATRADDVKRAALAEAFEQADCHDLARTVVVLGETPNIETVGTILVVAAGTSDLPVAEEAVVTARVMGNTVDTLYDVGVAGIHRLLASKDRFDGASVVVVAAGMEGALPSVVGGLV